MARAKKNDVEGRLKWMAAPPYDGPADGLPPFVVDESGKFLAQPTYTLTRESGEGYLLLYTLSGNGLLRYESGEYGLPPGSVALLDCRRRREYRMLDGADGGWIFYWFHFSGDAVPFYLRLIYPDSFAVLDMGAAPLPVFEDVLRALRFGDPESLLALSNDVYKILLMMADASRAGQTGRDRSIDAKGRIKEAVGYIGRNYWRNFDLGDMAMCFGMSKYHFLRLFKAYTGVPPYRYLLIERVNVAKLLLQTTDMGLSEISVMVGFANVSNFYRTFKSIAGVTPNAFRLNV